MNQFIMFCTKRVGFFIANTQNKYVIISSMKKRKFSLGNPMFPERKKPDMPDILHTDKSLPAHLQDADKSFLSQHGGKVFIVALSVAGYLIYGFFKGSSNKSELEDKILEETILEPYEINELRDNNFNLINKQLMINIINNAYDYAAQKQSKCEVSISPEYPEHHDHQLIDSKQSNTNSNNMQDIYLSYSDFISYINAYINNSKDSSNQSSSIALKTDQSAVHREYLQSGHLIDRIMVDLRLHNDKGSKDGVNSKNDRDIYLSPLVASSSSSSSSSPSYSASTTTTTTTTTGAPPSGSGTPPTTPESAESTADVLVSLPYLLVLLSLLTTADVDSRIDILYLLAARFSHQRNPSLLENVSRSGNNNEVGDADIVTKDGLVELLYYLKYSCQLPSEKLVTSTDKSYARIEAKTDLTKDTNMIITTFQSMLEWFYPDEYVEKTPLEIADGALTLYKKNFPDKYKQSTSNAVNSNPQGGSDRNVIKAWGDKGQGIELINKEEFTVLMKSIAICIWGECYRGHY